MNKIIRVWEQRMGVEEPNDGVRVPSDGDKGTKLWGYENPMMGVRKALNGVWEQKNGGMGNK